MASALRQRIIDGEFAPGSRLHESELALQLSVSRNTLREAFRVLEEQGLVNHVPHRGVSVGAPTTPEVLDIYRARRVMECGALAQAHNRHPAVQTMRAAVDRGEESARDGDWRRAGTANMAFHEAIIALTDSERLTRIFSDIAAELRLAFLEVDDPEALHLPFVGRNRAILETFLDDGPRAAADALDTYLTHSERIVLGTFERLGRSCSDDGLR